MDHEELSDQFPFAFARVTRRWRKLLDERLKDLGVTQARWTTMVYLQRGGEGLTQRELAQLMAIENPTLGSSGAQAAPDRSRGTVHEGSE